MNNIKLKIENLKKKIKYLDYYYYFLNKSIISDNKYDLLINKLLYLEKKYPYFSLINSPTKTIYNKLSKDFSKHIHLSPMLSLKNTYSNRELTFFYNKINKKFSKYKNIKYCCEIKLDGIAINLIYKNGKLFKALTRGNGLIGEDITKNIKYIKNIPLKLKTNKNNKFKSDLIEIRGEICISNNNLNNINNILLKNKKKIFSNNRNAVSGIMRNSKNNIIYNKSLKLFCYGIGFNFIKNKKNFYIRNSHYKLLNKIKFWGFSIYKYIKLFKSIKDIIKFYNYIENEKKNMEYKIDGIVIKLDNIKLQNELNYSCKYPNWSIAYKFSSEYKETKLIDINYNVGRTGVITPIAILDPILITGTIIKKTSLYNFKKINLLNLMIGDKVIIKKTGDIIPVIYKPIIKERIKNNLKKIYIPRKCPSCNNKIKINLNKLKCENGFFCNNQIKNKIIHFFSEKSIFIPEIDKKLINKLIKANKISSPLDIFKLNFDKINNSLNIDKKKCIIIKEFLKNKINVNLSNFIYSLSIDGVGINISNIISNEIKKIENFNEFNLIKLIKIKKINLNIINSIIIFLKLKKNKFFIKKLINNYINII